MADSYTTRGRHRKQSLGARLNAWGLAEGINGIVDSFDEGVYGVETITLTGAVSLSTANHDTDQARNIGFIFKGSPGTAVAVTVPDVESRYIVKNESGVTLTIKTSAGSGAAVRNGVGAVLISDGVTVTDATSRSIDQLETAAGNASLNGYKITDLGTPTAASDATNKSYVDVAIASAGVPATSGAVLISANDTTSRYLEDALVAGNGVTLTTNNDGADETLTVGVDFSTLTVTGNASLQSTLSVAGAVSLQSTLTVVGAVTLQSTLTVAGAASFYGDNNHFDNKIQRPKFQDISEVVTVITASGSSLSLSFEDGNVKDVTLTGNCSITLTGAPASGTYGGMYVYLRQDNTGSRTITHPGGTQHPGGEAPTLTATSGGYDAILYETFDGGTTYVCHVVGQDFQ